MLRLAGVHLEIHNLQTNMSVMRIENAHSQTITRIAFNADGHGWLQPAPMAQ